MKSTAAQAKENEQAHEKYRPKSSIVRSLKLKPTPAATRAQAYSPANANIWYTGVGGNTDESRAEEKSAEHRARVQAARKKKMEKLVDADRKAYSSVR